MAHDFLIKITTIDKEEELKKELYNLIKNYLKEKNIANNIVTTSNYTLTIY